MKSIREITWSQKLKKRLQCEVNGDSGDQIVWLVDHLDQYLGRWLGFAQSGQVKIAATLNNDTFWVVLAAVEVIESVLDEMGCTRPFPQKEWDTFCAALKDIQKKPVASSIIPINQSFEAFRINFG